MAIEVHSRQIAELLSKPYRMVVRGDEAEGYLAEAPELPGCVTAGETPAAALELLRDAMAGWFESAIERHLPIPDPTDETYNGRILLRVPKTLHRQLVEQARDQGVSLNQWILTLLAMRSAIDSRSAVQAELSRRIEEVTRAAQADLSRGIEAATRSIESTTQAAGADISRAIEAAIRSRK